MSFNRVPRLERCHAQLREFFDEVLRGVPVEKILEPAVEGKWPAHEHLAHLGRYHEVFLQRIDLILKEDNPRLARYRAEDDPEWEHWKSLSYKEIAARLADLRERLVTKLKSLAPEDYARTGVHPKFGEMSLALWLEFFLVHEGHHLYAVFQLARRKD